MGRNDPIELDWLRENELTLKITGKYDWFLVVHTWWLDNVLNIPTLITWTWWDLDNIVNNKLLLFDWESNMPIQYKWLDYKELVNQNLIVVNPWKYVVFTWSLSELSDGWPNWIIARNKLIENIQKASSWTILADKTESKEILSINLSNTWSVEYLSTNIVHYKLWLKINIAPKQE